MMNPMRLEAVTRASWDFLLAGEGRRVWAGSELPAPRAWDITLRRCPEAINAHRKTIQVLDDVDYDLDRATRRLTSGKQNAGDLTDRSRRFRVALIEFVRRWQSANP